MEKAKGKEFTIYTDGAARGNPGPSASGFIIIDKDGNEIYRKSIYNGIKTNNFAEYNAMIKALEWCESNMENPEGMELTFISDSELVVNQLNGRYKIRSAEMAELNSTVKELAKWFKSVKFINRRRSDSGISAVDKGLNELLDKREKRVNKKF